jgi:hypothetical protein
MNNFDDLSLDERAEIVWRGRYSETINYYNFKLNLYILEDGSFAEVWYSPVENEITDIKIVYGDELKKWLSRINLSL